MELYRISAIPENILRFIGSIVLLGALGIGGGSWLFIWYGSAERDFAALRQVKKIEELRTREKELIAGSTTISGRVLSVAENELILVNEAAERGMLRILMNANTKVYAWGGGDNPQKIEVSRSDILPRSLITIRSSEPIRGKTEVAPHEILKLE